MTGAAQPTANAAAGAALSGLPLWGAGFVLALANFMSVLDSTIANVSVPHIAGGLAVSPNEGTWVITSYSVAEAITVPLTGWLAQRFGAVRVFTAALALFGLFSALCGLAPSLTFLVVCRVLQGLAGGPMIPLSQTLLLRVFPPKLAPQAIGLWSMTTVVAPIAGPLLGGLLCDEAGWPWVFYINVPVAAAVAFATWRMITPFETPVWRRPVDFVGLALLILWVGCMQIMLDKGEESDWFNSSFIAALAIIAVIGFVAFIIWELTAEDPIVNLRLFGNRAFATSAAVMTLTFGAFIVSVVIVPLWLQTSLGFTATWAGRVTAMNGMSAVIMSPIAAQLVRRFDPRILVTYGVGCMALVMFWRSFFNTEMNYWALALPQFALGFFMPFFFVPVTSMAMGALKPEQTAAGAGLISFTRTTAGAFGVSLGTTAWSDATIRAHSNAAGALNDAAAAAQQLANVGFSSAQAIGNIDRLVQVQAVMLATNHMFKIIAAIMAVAALSVWIAPKPKGPVQARADH